MRKVEIEKLRQELAEQSAITTVNLNAKTLTVIDLEDNVTTYPLTLECGTVYALMP